MWVLAQHNEDDKWFRAVAITATLDAAQQAAIDDLDPDWPTPEWVQQPDGSWTTYLQWAIRYTAEEFEVTL